MGGKSSPSLGYRGFVRFREHEMRGDDSHSMATTMRARRPMLV